MRGKKACFSKNKIKKKKEKKEKKEKKKRKNEKERTRKKERKRKKEREREREQSLASYRNQIENYFSREDKSFISLTAPRDMLDSGNEIADYVAKTAMQPFWPGEIV